MKRPLIALLLAGRIRPSPLREAVDLPVLCLPVGRQGTVLDAWLDELGRVGASSDVRVVVNTLSDVKAVNDALVSRGASIKPGVRIVAEPAAWRGAAGILRDVAIDAPPDAIVLACESKRLPPRTIEPMLRAVEHDTTLDGVVGVCGDDEPAGVFAFTRQALDAIPSIGYYDLKEQFLPALNDAGKKIQTALVGEQVLRLRDRETYLEAVRMSLVDAHRTDSVRIAPRASVSATAIIDGFSIIESDVVIEDGAVVHDSVVLWGARVGGGAVLSNCVIGPGASVEPRTQAVSMFVTKPQPGRGAKSSDRRRRVVDEAPLW